MYTESRMAVSGLEFESDFETDKCELLAADGLCLCWANCNSKLKSMGSRTKNYNWAFLMGYMTVSVGFKATLSASNSAQKCV